MEFSCRPLASVKPKKIIIIGNGIATSLEWDRYRRFRLGAGHQAFWKIWEHKDRRLPITGNAGTFVRLTAKQRYTASVCSGLPRFFEKTAWLQMSWPEPAHKSGK